MENGFFIAIAAETTINRALAPWFPALWSIGQRGKDDKAKYSGLKEIHGGDGVRKVNTECCQYLTKPQFSHKYADMCIISLLVSS